MCHRYHVKPSAIELAKIFNTNVQQNFSWAAEIFPGSRCPAITNQVVPMFFGRPGKSPMNNARVENLRKWPWHNRCVVPMTSFREPLYWGPDEGTEANFFSSETLKVAAIFSGPFVTLIMRPASDYVLKNGHHREPYFLDEVDDWLEPGFKELSQVEQLLQDNAAEPELSHVVAREMAPSWKKRQASYLRKRDSAQLDSPQKKSVQQDLW